MAMTLARSSVKGKVGRNANLGTKQLGENQAHAVHKQQLENMCKAHGKQLAVATSSKTC